nr:hypothetical protein [uncultured Kingella sp.]
MRKNTKGSLKTNFRLPFEFGADKKNALVLQQARNLQRRNRGEIFNRLRG